MMVRHLIEQGATSLADLKSFTADGYAYSASESSDEWNPVFIR